jgi:hypothetical protein
LIPSQRPEQKATTTTTASKTVFRISSWPTRAGPAYAGITQGEAVQRARQVVIRGEYRGETSPSSIANTGDAAMTRKSRIGSHIAWLIRFEDNQVPKISCVAVRRRVSGVTVANEVPCGGNSVPPSE